MKLLFCSLKLIHIKQFLPFQGTSSLQEGSLFCYPDVQFYYGTSLAPEEIPILENKHPCLYPLI